MSTPTEWNFLKHQFDALVHGESVDADKVRRRFAEIINRDAERQSRTWTLAGSCDRENDFIR